MDETRKLAGDLVDLTYRDFSKDAIDKAKGLVLDQLGIQLAVSTKPWSLAAYRYVRDFGSPGGSTIVNYGGKSRTENAAFANAIFGHGFEMDDTYLPGNTHPGCIAVSSALAVGESELIDGKSFLAAMAVGYEAIGRVSRAVAPSTANRGFHSVAVSGPFGSAAVTGKILGFDREMMTNALSIAGSHASGIGEYTQTGGSIKRVHAGMAAFGGIRAAMLARAGITGPPTALEGKKGFCHAFADKFRIEDLSARPGEGLVVGRTAIKRHCSCYQIQAPIEATGRIIREHNIKTQDIAEIVMGTTEHAMGVVGVIVEPTDITSSQFSARFGIGMCIIKGGNGFQMYTEENLKDPAILDTARRVRLEVDKEVEACFPAKRAIRMTVRLKDGTTYQQWLEGARGTPENPMTQEEIEEKFRSLAAVVIPDRQADEIIKVVANLEDLGNIATLARLLVC